MPRRRIISVAKVEKPKVRRKGVHSKTKTSKLKASKNYKKAYRGQGRWDIQREKTQHLLIQVLLDLLGGVCVMTIPTIQIVVMELYGLKVLEGQKVSPKI